MRKLILITCCVLFSTLINAQSFAIAADKMNIAYIGQDNPLTIVSDNCSCKDIFAITDNGTLTKRDSCKFGYMPSKSGNAIITIQKKQNGKLVKIGEQVWRCKYIPDPYAVVGNKQSGPFPLAQFKVQQGVVATFGESFDLDIQFIVFGFKITLSSNNQVLYSEETGGYRFSSNTINAFNRLKTGDTVIIEHIKAGGPNSMIRILQTLTFVMR